MTLKLQLELIGLFVGLFALGTIACLPLYQWDIRKFVRSSLWTKIYWWIPIFSIFCVLLWVHQLAVVVASGLAIQAIRELHRQRCWDTYQLWPYLLGFTLGLISLATWFYVIPEPQATQVLIYVCIASVLSDVCAFFAGNYMGKHALPNALNSRKSWEGVAGQVVGAIVGIGLLWAVTPLVFLLVLGILIGCASAIGDLANSYCKRILGIKDWGTAIPGHGGVLDRFSSLSYALCIGALYTLL